jgi:hypothetical protein
MDAMQKRKVWRVAIGHFALSCFLAEIAPNFARVYYPWTKESYYSEIWLANFLIAAICFFQPFPYWVSVHKNITLPNWLTIVALCSIPIWSMIFSWLYVRFTNWLNHFPVLGKRVF